MRVLGIDYGERRVGISVSDESGTLAGESFVIDEPSPAKRIARLIEQIRLRAPERIVLGLPKNMDGTVGERANVSLALADTLRAECGVEVILWDERRTSIDAHRILRDAGHKTKKHKQKVDAVAASLILQGYLDSI